MERNIYSSENVILELVCKMNLEPRAWCLKVHHFCNSILKTRLLEDQIKQLSHFSYITNLKQV